MNPASAFLVDIAFVVALSVGIVAYVKSHLNSLLIDLCGTPERASFWLAFSNVTMVFVSLIFALDYNPEFGPDRNCLFERATQLKRAIVGFVITLPCLAFILYRFIPRENPTLRPGSSR